MRQRRISVRLETDWRTLRFCTAARWPAGGQDVVDALLPDEEFPISYTGAQARLPMAASLMAADLFQTSGFDKEGALNNMAHVAKQISGRAVGFELGRLLPFFPRFAKVGAACGVYFDHRSQLAGHAGWVLRNRINWEIIGDRLRDAANFGPSLHMVA